MFYIPAINFPQWFISANSEIKPLNEWRKEWQIRKCNDGKMTYFVPPRDPNKKTYRKIKAEVLHDDVEYGLLKPVPLLNRNTKHNTLIVIYKTMRILWIDTIKFPLFFISPNVIFYSCM